MFARHMTTRGKQLAALFGLALAFLMPKKVECGFPGASCRHPASYGRSCVTNEVEPLGFYAIEWLTGRNIGFAYTSEEECR